MRYGVCACVCKHLARGWRGVASGGGRGPCGKCTPGPATRTGCTAAAAGWSSEPPSPEGDWCRGSRRPAAHPSGWGTRGTPASPPPATCRPRIAAPRVEIRGRGIDNIQKDVLLYV
eukprot:3948828-Pyramimonas_sp.AAC.1